MNPNQQSKLNRLIARKKTEDATGFLKAQQNGALLEYLKNELKEAGIDPSVIHFDQGANINCSTSSSSSASSGENMKSFSFEDVNNYISYASSQLDLLIFAPFFRSQSEFKDHSSLMQKLSLLRSFQKVSQRLQTLKVISFSLAVICGLSGLRNLSSNPLIGVIQLLAAHDSSRISYNCYIQKYLSVSIQYLTGDLTSLSNTVLQVASTALGLSNRPDPLMVLEHGVYWKSIFHDTLSKVLYTKVGKFCINYVSS